MNSISNNMRMGDTNTVSTPFSLKLQLHANKVNNPYTLTLTKPLWSKADVAKDVWVVSNMYDYAQKNISEWSTMTSIPRRYSPEFLDTSTANDFSYAFNNCSNLTSLPTPFYDMGNVTMLSSTFKDCSNIKDFSMVNLGNKVTNMGSTFSSCSNLLNAPVIPNSVINMYYTFYYCNNLVNAPVIPNSVTDMRYTFSSCSSLVNAPVIPNSVTDMSGTFSSCSNLVNAPVIPNSVTNMKSTFRICSNLVNAPVIPNSVTTMSSTFSSCSNLVNAPVIPNSVTDMSSTFQICSNLVNAPVIPNSVTDMSSTFQICSNLVNAPVIPDSVTNMYSTFHYCSNLRGDIYIHSNNVMNATNCMSNHIHTINYTRNIIVPANSTTYNTFYTAMGNTTYNSNWNAYLLAAYDTIKVTNMYSYAKLNIPDYTTITQIPDQYLPAGRLGGLDTSTASDWVFAFNMCSNLTSLPNPFYNMSNASQIISMFYNCTNIRDFSMVNLGNKATSMYLTFHNCANMINAPVIPNSVTNMCSTFNMCANLVNAPVIPNKVTDMRYAFRNCYNLLNVPTIPNSVTDMLGTFQYCNSLVNAPAFGNNVINMVGTFQYCNSLVNAPVIPNSVTNMQYAFYGCSNLVNAPVIPNSVTNMCHTFYRCYNLVNVPTISNSVTNMYETFYYCKNLVNAPVIPNSVTNMYGTFEGCYNLVNAPVIPNSVTNMYGTFEECSSLVNAPVIPNGVTDMYRTFAYCSNLVNAPVIPNSVTDMSGTFAYCPNIRGDIYVYSNNVSSASACFARSNSYNKCIIVYPNTTTYNTFYTEMDNSTTNAIWNATLRTLQTVTIQQSDNQLITVNYNGTNYTNTFEAVSGYPYTVTVTATTEGYQPGTPSTESGTITGDITISATPVTKSGIINVIQPEHGYITVNGEVGDIFTYPYGTEITIQAYADEGYEVKELYYNDEDYSKLILTATIEQSENQLITVNYGGVEHTSTFSAPGGGLYTTTIEPTNEAYNAGTVNNPKGVLTTDITFTATPAEIKTYTVLLEQPENGYITLNGQAGTEFTVNHGDSITVQAFANELYEVEGLYMEEFTKLIGDSSNFTHEVTAGTATVGNYSFVGYNGKEKTIDSGAVPTFGSLTPTSLGSNTINGLYIEHNNVSGANNLCVEFESEPSFDYMTLELNSETLTLTKSNPRTLFIAIDYNIEELMSEFVNATSGASIFLTVNYISVKLTAPFSDNSEYLTNLVDGSNFEISGDYIQSGSNSYNVANGKSTGYIQFTTPSNPNNIHLSVSCYTSSQMNWDWGAVYVGTSLYYPSDYNAIKSEITDGKGSYLYTGSGTNISLRTYTIDKSLLRPNTVYYISFTYMKNGSNNSNMDRFFIKDISFTTD